MRLWHRCFLVSFAKSLRIATSKNISGSYFWVVWVIKSVRDFHFAWNTELRFSGRSSQNIKIALRLSHICQSCSTVVTDFGNCKKDRTKLKLGLLLKLTFAVSYYSQKLKLKLFKTRIYDVVCSPVLNSI